ncbi:PilZ domain-containing protein [Thalassotalea agarivorans]|uniref:PilZ domain-containing protein n=1 Tax=Thalassotalea agarivorans TaxID=349064 RepID=A0A1I0CLJ8_THASX|nr:PilZ domain-containing protein [Thalassotalea agarivorans]SET20556.1 PilZ domain-containing protein [Thalassotalea agarivorans]
MTDSSNEDVERRQSIRLDMEKEIVDIQWTDENNNTRMKKVACVDISRAGIKLDCDQDIPLETRVQVTLKPNTDGSQELGGTVARCIQQDNGWFDIALAWDEGSSI